jgi:anaerobic magnesium-protoporphyrin IX monomethyl ester cyclase
MSANRTVVLVHPRTTRHWSAQPWCDLPLELICVGSPLARKGYRVRIIDQRVQADWRERLLSALAEKPICVGVTSTTGPQLRQALHVSQLVKQHQDVPVVWGGTHATLLPEQTLERPEIDYIVQAEGERTFEELVAELERGPRVRNVAGVWWKEQGRAISGGRRPFIDLNEEPYLDYDLVDVRKYKRTVFGVERLSFSTSRGCCYPCAFCYSTVVHRRQWRALRADLAVEQMKEFTGRYGVRGLFLTDANFFLDLDRARAILEKIVSENLGLVFTRLHIRFDTMRRLSDEDLALIERAGCKCLAVGVESGSARIRALLHKPVDEDELRDINRRFMRFSIMPMYFFMIGYPTETREELKATAKLFTRLVTENPRAWKSVNTYAPFPGTELYDLAVAEGLKPPARLEEWFSFSYRQLGAEGSWLPERTRKTVQMLDFCSFFVGERGYAKPFKKTSWLASSVARAYAPIARIRVTNLLDQMPLEIAAARRLGLYGYDD